MRVFLLAFLGLNLLQSGSTPLLYDEAYFWYYAQNPALGYFEYPPMIAWMIALGQAFFKGELGIRLITTLFGAGTALFLWMSQVAAARQGPSAICLVVLCLTAFTSLHLYQLAEFGIAFFYCLFPLPLYMLLRESP